MSPESVLSCEGITLRHAGRAVLENLSLDLRAREILALVGPSGSGKTSVIRTLLGLVRPERGRVRLGSEVATDGPRLILPPEQRNLAVVFQDLALWPHLTVHGNLAFALDARGTAKAERDDRIATMLRRVGLDGMQRRHPGELSGGERQRVAVARALVLAPRAVLLDEPLANLDVGLKRELLALFRELLVERRTAAIFVTHSARATSLLSERVVVVERGQVTQVGTMRDLARKPATTFVATFVDDGAV